VVAVMVAGTRARPDAHIDQGHQLNLLDASSTPKPPRRRRRSRRAAMREAPLAFRHAAMERR
jgi:hypothetical protein